MLRGLGVSENRLGFTAVRLHYTADPEKDPAHPVYGESAQRWLDAQRALWPDPNDFEREFEINFFVGKGTRVFPQFREQEHTRSLQWNRRKILYRGWDFGWHCPVCLVAQTDGHDRLLILKELVGGKQTTQQFAQHVISECARLFPNAAGYEDYCDPAGQQVKSIESEKSERRDVEILNGLGIYPRWEYGWSAKDGRSLIHQLLQLRTDATPGVYVDIQGCPLLVQAALGQYVYPETRAGRVREDPNDDEHPWGDIIAAWRYLVTGLRNKLGIRRLAAVASLSPPPSKPGFHGYGTKRKC